MIGKKERVPLREVWKHEALDFTKWLEENFDVLGDALEGTGQAFTLYTRRDWSENECIKSRFDPDGTDGRPRWHDGIIPFNLMKKQVSGSPS